MAIVVVTGFFGTWVEWDHTDEGKILELDLFRERESPVRFCSQGLA